MKILIHDYFDNVIMSISFPVKVDEPSLQEIKVIAETYGYSFYKEFVNDDFDDQVIILTDCNADSTIEENIDDLGDLIKALTLKIVHDEDIE